MPKIKICGLTNLADALFACELGADALGFIFYRNSPRYISPENVIDIAKELPPFVARIGVFVNENLGVVNEISTKLNLDRVQLHGDESPDYCQQIATPVIKAFRIGGFFDVNVLGSYDVPAFLLDTYSIAGYGGTGECFDWNIALAAKKHGRIILSGGITEHNVVEAIRSVNPHAVDVCSGVESEPGKKDHRRLEGLFHKIQELYEPTKNVDGYPEE